MLYVIVAIMLAILIIIGIGCWYSLKQQINHTKNLESAIYRLIEITKSRNSL